MSILVRQFTHATHLEKQNVSPELTGPLASLFFPLDSLQICTGGG